jgi:hypothetical protein
MNKQDYILSEFFFHILFVEQKEGNTSLHENMSTRAHVLQILAVRWGWTKGLAPGKASAVCPLSSGLSGSQTHFCSSE